MNRSFGRSSAVGQNGVNVTFRASNDYTHLDIESVFTQGKSLASKSKAGNSPIGKRMEQV